MIEEGMELNINGKKGTVCFIKEYNGQKYLNIAFQSEEKNEYKIYKCQIIGDEVSLILEKDQRILSDLAIQFINEGLENIKDN